MVRAMLWTGRLKRAEFDGNLPAKTDAGCNERGIALLFILTAGFYTIIPVHADMISPAITHVYAGKDVMPYKGTPMNRL